MGEEAETKDLFLFVNPTSGGNLASAYTKLKEEEGGKDNIDISVDSIGNVCLHIFNIKDGKPGNKPGFHMLKTRIEELRSTRTAPYVRVKVGGGDGTVMWAFTEILAHNIDPDDLVVGVIPFGTGNDFSRTLGWGGAPPKTLIGPDRRALKEHIKQWMTAKVVDFDLWTIELETHDGGGFLFINDKKKKDLTEGNKAQHNITVDGAKMTMIKPMCNYFSIGYDGRTGLGFDKGRTKSAFLNLGVYGWEGAKKMCCRRPPPTRAVVDKIESIDANGQSSLFAVSEHKASSTGPTFIGTPIDLIYLNIPSYAKGCDPWTKAKKSAVTKNGKTRMDLNERKDLTSEAQIIGDHRLSVITYCGYLSYMSDVLSGQAGMHGMVNSARRVGQTPLDGQSIIHFRSKETLDAKKGRVYMQIDGEFFIVEYPSKVALKHMKTVKVLLSPKQFDPGCCGCCGCGRKKPEYHPTASRGDNQL